MSCKCSDKPKGCAVEYEYAVKAVSGLWQECPPGEPTRPVAPGSYYTAINIHNPSKCELATVRWKVVEAPQLGSGAQRELRPEDRGSFTLRPDYAVEIDNPQILQRKDRLKGFVVLYSPIELDVVAVYSGTQGANWPLNVFHTERVPARCVEVCEDLDLNLSTGVADWKLVSPQQGSAYVLTPAPGGAAPAGSQWVGAAYTDGNSAPGNGAAKVFELAFDLCYGFRTGPVALQVNVDDTAQVFLNGQPIGNAPFNTVTPLTIPAAAFLPGPNVLRVVVSNTGAGGNGFALSGRLLAAGGRCPCKALPLRPVKNSETLPFVSDPSDLGRTF